MATTKDTYNEAVGRRKTSIARVRVSVSSTSKLVVNGKPLEEYFPTRTLQQLVVAPLSSVTDTQFSVSIKVQGGGISSQAVAIRHGISRALIKRDQSVRPALKVQGFLTRDPREKERRKFGLRKARRAPQWSKR